MAKKTAVGSLGWNGDWEDVLRLILLLSALGLPIPPKWKAAAAAMLYLWKFLR
jgi:hypothetical protein